MKKIHNDQIDLLELTREHITVLASYAASEVFAAFNPNEPRSIREVASEIGKTSASVGEHVTKLVSTGLLVQVGTRKRRSRTESLYSHRGLATHFDLGKQPLSVIEKYIERFRGQMRLADRQHEAAQYAAHADPKFLQFFKYECQNIYATPEVAEQIKEGINKLIKETIAANEGDPSKRESKEYVRINVMAYMLPTQVESRHRISKNQKLG